MDIDHDTARVRFPPPLAFVAALLIGMGLERVIGSPEIPVIGSDTLHTLGILAIVLGAGIVLSAIGLFRRAGTDPKPWKPSSALVTDGVFRWSRNPMYFGMALAYAGVAMLLDSLTVLALLVPLILILQKEVIEPEEAYLEQRFGPAYREYRTSVRRWI